MLPTRILPVIDTQTQARPILPNCRCTTWVISWLAIAFTICFPICATADTVSGHIYGQDKKPVANKTLVARKNGEDGIPFRTDSSGNFSVYLDPGQYTVTPNDDATLQGVINSFPQPVQQDIQMQKRGR